MLFRYSNNCKESGGYQVYISKKIKIITLVFGGSLFLTGCLGQKTVEEKMYDVLEKVVSVEARFEAQQAPLLELEKEEKKLYENMVSIGIKEQEKLNKLADEAIVIVDKRKERIMEEQKSMEASEREFEKLDPLVGKLNDLELEDRVDELSEVMNQRYQIHRKLSEYYLEGLGLDTDLYKMLKSEDRPIEKLEKQIILINETYDQVLEANKQFNELTEKYNEKKISLYKEAGLTIQTK